MAAYAEAVSDGIGGELRRSLFGAIWVQGLHLSSPYEVRRLVTELTWPREDVAQRLASPDFPGLLLRDPDVTRVVRGSGGTIALNGRAADHDRLAAGPAVAARVAGAAQPGDPRRHRL